jgi:hypothetical protein
LAEAGIVVSRVIGLKTVWIDAETHGSCKVNAPMLIVYQFLAIGSQGFANSVTILGVFTIA